MKKDYDQLHKIFVTKEDEDFYRKKDRQFFADAQRIIESHGIPLKDQLVHFPSFVPRRNLPKFLALYEVFKMARELPGSIAELGVYKGSGLFTWANLLETFLPGERMKKVYGFDHFKGYAAFDGKDTDANWVKEKHNNSILDDSTHGFIEDLVHIHNRNSFLPGVERIVLIDGDILETVPSFAQNNMGVRFCILNIDVNLYRPVATVLRYFYDLVLPGGVVMLSGFSAPPWEGEARAIEEEFSRRSLPIPQFRRFDFSPYPRAYFIK